MDVLTYAVLITAIAALIYSNMSLRASISTRLSTRSVISGSSGLQVLIEPELERARRLKYPLSIVIIRPRPMFAERVHPEKILELINADMNTRTAVGMDSGQGGVATIVPLRSTDVAVYDAKENQFVLVLVGTRKSDADRIGDRVASCVTNIFNQVTAYGSAEFPEEALFLPELVEKAERSANRYFEVSSAPALGIEAAER